MKLSYTAKNARGGIQNGVIEAPNKEAAAKALHEQSLFVMDITAESHGPNLKSLDLQIPFLGQRVSLKDRIIFTKQLAMMIKSGLPLIDAFKALEEQTENKYFSGVLHDISDKVRGGQTLSISLGKYPKIFSDFYVSIVSSGEKSGKLDEVLTRLADELEKEYDLITKIKGAITYPIVIVCALVGVVIIMIVFVVPQIQKIFTDMGVDLPLVTRVILGISYAVRKFWYLFLIIIAGLIFGIRFYIKTAQGHLLWDTIKIKVPLIGKVARKIYIARFCRTTGTLVAAGLPILDIIKTIGEVINNEVYKNSLKKVGREIESGKTFSEALRKEKYFPPMIYHLIYVGEKTGKLDQVLLESADFFDKEVEASTANMANLIEPILIILIGAGVGLVVASVIMPIYSLVNVI